jgi:hypothetical protein
MAGSADNWAVMGPLTVQYGLFLQDKGKLLCRHPHKYRSIQLRFLGNKKVMSLVANTSVDNNSANSQNFMENL